MPLPTTTDVCEAALKADPTVPPQQRADILTWLRNFDPQARQAAPQGPRVLSRKATASTFGRSLRFVDKLGEAGVLRRVTLPGRTRACGFLAEDVEAVLRAGVRDDG